MQFFQKPDAGTEESNEKKKDKKSEDSSSIDAHLEDVLIGSASIDDYIAGI